jgi:hypothetical protein
MLKHKLIPFVVLVAFSLATVASKQYVNPRLSNKPIVFAQERNAPEKNLMSVPFKGLITREGIAKEGKAPQRPLHSFLLREDS